MRHLVLAGPAVGRTVDLGGVGDVARQERAFAPEAGEHVGAKAGVRGEPLAAALAPRPRPHGGEHQGKKADRPEGAVELEQETVHLDGFAQLTRFV